MQYKYPLSHTPIDRQALNEVLRDYEGDKQGQLVVDFERRVAHEAGTRYAVALTSGAAALHLGLKALGVGMGDEVLVSTFTYVGSVNPILYVGAKPVFIDSEKKTWNLDPSLLKDAIESYLKNGKKPKAIMVVHTYGMPACMDEIEAIAQSFQIPILEDAAEAIGSTYHGRKAGSMGDLGVISFNVNKTITTYGGGALTMNDGALYEKIVFWASQSREPVAHYEHTEPGFSYRMGPLNAAYGIASLPSLKDKINSRRKCYDIYAAALRSRYSIGEQIESPNIYSNRWLPAFYFNNIHDRDHLKATLSRAGMESRYLWKSMHIQPLFFDADSVLNGFSEDLFRQGLCLPTGDETMMHEVVNIINGRA